MKRDIYSMIIGYLYDGRLVYALILAILAIKKVITIHHVRVVIDYVNKLCMDIEYKSSPDRLHRWLRNTIKIKQCNIAESTVRSWLSQLKDIIENPEPGVYKLKRGVRVDENLIRSTLKEFDIDIDAIIDVIDRKVRNTLHALNVSIVDDALRALRASIPEVDYLLELFWIDPEYVKRLAKLVKQHGLELLDFNQLKKQLQDYYAQILQLESKLQAYEKELQRYRSELEQCRHELGKYEQRLRECVGEIDELVKLTGPIVEKTYQLQVRKSLLSKTEMISVQVRAPEKTILLIDKLREVIQDDKEFYQVLRELCEKEVAECNIMSVSD